MDLCLYSVEVPRPCSSYSMSSTFGLNSASKSMDLWNYQKWRYVHVICILILVYLTPTVKILFVVIWAIHHKISSNFFSLAVSKNTLGNGRQARYFWVTRTGHFCSNFLKRKMVLTQLHVWKIIDQNLFVEIYWPSEAVSVLEGTM